jgi:hypothetical protein
MLVLPVMVALAPCVVVEVAVPVVGVPVLAVSDWLPLPEVALSPVVGGLAVVPGEVVPGAVVPAVLEPLALSVVVPLSPQARGTRSARGSTERDDENIPRRYTGASSPPRGGP